jgi:hypothetical protein
MRRDGGAPGGYFRPSRALQPFLRPEATTSIDRTKACEDCGFPVKSYPEISLRDFLAIIQFLFRISAVKYKVFGFCH